MRKQLIELTERLKTAIDQCEEHLRSQLFNGMKDAWAACLDDIQRILDEDTDDAHEAQPHRCDGCRHFRQYYNKPTQGLCVFNEIGFKGWPETEGDADCSKWEAQS